MEILMKTSLTLTHQNPNPIQFVKYGHLPAQARGTCLLSGGEECRARDECDVHQDQVGEQQPFLHHQEAGAV